MDKDKKNTCCFFGHRKIAQTEELRIELYRIIQELVEQKNVHTFLFGSKSRFDSLCYEIVSRLKEKYPHIRRVYVRAEFPYISDEYKNHLLDMYEDTYYPDNIIGSGKAVYVERNCEMIDKSAFCVVYYDAGYLPPKRKNSKKDVLEYQPNSGTRLAYEYAMKKGLNIINTVR